MLVLAAVVAAVAVLYEHAREGYPIVHPLDNVAYCAANMEYARQATGAEVPLFAWLRQKGHEFANHLRTYHAANPMAQALLATWRGEVLVSTKNTGATFDRRIGCMIINPSYETKKKRAGPGFDAQTRLLTRLLHELAHSWSGPHNTNFYEAQRWFLRVATEELGWTVDVTCRVCCSYQGACTPEAVCPKCRWIETQCTLTKKSCGDGSDDLRSTS